MARRALLIATDAYRDPRLGALQAPVREAQQLRDLLRDPDVGYFDSVHLLENESKTEAERGIERLLRDAAAGDTVLLYLSCHGIVDPAGQLYFAVGNTEFDLPMSTAIPAVHIHRLVEMCDADAKIILLDCCYSGAIVRERTARGGDLVDLKGELLAGRGTYFLAASNAVQPAYEHRDADDPSKPAQSLFTGAVLAGLSTGAADLEHDGRITPDELYRYVHREVRQRSAWQNPVADGSLEGEIYVAWARRGPHSRPRPATVGDTLTLGDLLPGITASETTGLRAEGWWGTGRLAVPLGRSYRPGEDGGEPVWVDFATGSGHLLVVGRLGSGKSVLLTTLVGGLALTHGPGEIALYALEAASNRLGSLRALPHLRDVAGDDEPERVDGILAGVEELTRNRQKLFRRYGIGSLAGYRAWRDGSRASGDHADVFLLIDGWQSFGTSEAFTARVRDLAGAGPAYGVHLVVTSRWWEAVPQDLVYLLQSHVELRLDDPRASRIDPDTARQLPEDTSGWGLRLGRRFQIAVPRIDRALTVDVTPDGTADLVNRLVEAWPDQSDLLLARPPKPRTRPATPVRPGIAVPADSAPGRPVTSAPGGPGGPASPATPATPATPGGAATPATPATATPAAGTPGGPATPVLADEATSGAEPPRASYDLVGVLGLGDPRQFDPAAWWRGRSSGRHRLRIPIGVGVFSEPVFLDLKEAAQGGMGPHGLVTGARGSGKSELLRSLVLALAATHSPEVVNFLLVAFTGGAGFTTLDRLPHTSALVTNLEDDPALVDRMAETVEGELSRRKELLRTAGNYASHRDYQRAAARAELPVLPSLLLVVDEFAGLLAAKPDFSEVLSHVGRVGRSLGVHLLLASQGLRENQLRGLDRYLSYRIALRTDSVVDSRLALGVPDAYELPATPGHAYLKTGSEAPTRFTDAYASGPVAEDDATGPAGRVTVSDVLVSQLEGLGPRARPVWLPPPDDAPALDQLLPPVDRDPLRGLTVDDPAWQGSLRAVAGVVDRPFEQRLEPLRLDLAGAAGHTVIVGGPKSGKSNLLRTVVTSLALTHTPREAQFYCLDFGGGGLTELRELPHVGGVATRLDDNAVRRTVAQVATVMRRRERDFGDTAVDGIATYRRLRREGQVADDPYGDVFLVVDNWIRLREEFEDLEPTVTAIAQSGLGVGVHLLVTATRWRDVRPALRDLFGTRLELRLSDPIESEVDRGAAANVPDAVPGRGLTADGQHFLAGVPRIDGRSTADGLTEGVAGLVDAVRQAWPGDPAPPVLLLPTDLPYRALPDPSAQSRPGIPVGIAEDDLEPVYLDFAADPHLLLFGDVESGKSTFLRVLANAIAERYRPKRAQLMVVDYRRSLAEVVGEGGQLLGYGASASVTTDLVAQVTSVMRERMPGPDVTPEQLRNRSWWSGPELYLLVDDYDLVAGAASNPLLPLADLLPYGRDIGLHLVLARRTGGASRALYDPIVSTLRDLDSPGILLSGDPGEGPLLGRVKPQPLPPGRGWLVTRRHGARLVQLARDA